MPVPREFRCRSLITQGEDGHYTSSFGILPHPVVRETRRTPSSEAVERLAIDTFLKAARAAGVKVNDVLRAENGETSASGLALLVPGERYEVLAVTREAARTMLMTGMISQHEKAYLQLIQLARGTRSA